MADGQVDVAPPPLELARGLDGGEIDREIFALAADLYPICRSIAGGGVRDTLCRIAAHCDLALHDVPTGAKVLDWTIPREWNARDAFIKNADGVRVLDFNTSNLHVVSHSVPVHRTLS